MKKIIYTLFILGFPGLLIAQKIGVNTTTPYSALHISSPADYTLTLENPYPLGYGNLGGILFTNNMTGSGNYFKGGIQSIGESSNSARLGFFTGATFNPFGMTEQLTIANNGYIGIGNTTPASKLDVSGNTHITGNLGVHTPVSTYSLDVAGNTRIAGNIGINAPPSDYYCIDAIGPARLQNDLRINGILNPNNQLVIGNSVAVESFMTVYGGKGIVRSTSSTQMKMKRLSASFSASNFAAGATITSGLLHFNEDFDAATVTVGNIVTGTGDWAKVMLVPFNVDLDDDSCQFALTNVSSATIAFTGTWTFVVVGN